MKRILYFFIILFLSTIVNAEEILHDFKVIRVIDGDTIEIEAPFLPIELGQTLPVRIRNVDTPEKGHLAKCQQEEDLSKEATYFTEHEIAKAKKVRILFVSWDKYARVIGDVLLDDKKYLSELLLEKGFAISYNGEKKTKNWCNKI